MINAATRDDDDTHTHHVFNGTWYGHDTLSIRLLCARKYPLLLGGIIRRGAGGVGCKRMHILFIGVSPPLLLLDDHVWTESINRNFTWRTNFESYLIIRQVPATFSYLH